MMNWFAEPQTCPGLFYRTPVQDGFLIRIRIPGGLLNYQQGRAIAQLLAELATDQRSGNETIQITNRANLQIRSVHIALTAEVLQTLQSLKLAAQNPTVDHLRNLMASPTAGIDPQELINTCSFIEALDTYIQSRSELTDLPAKFSIGIDGGGTVGIGTRSPIAWEHRYNEIQLSAVLLSQGVIAPEKWQPEQVYFRLALGADRQMVDTQVLIAPDEFLSVVEALVAVYLSYVYQNCQMSKKPRMKHLLQDWGREQYLEQVSRQLPFPLRQVTNCPKLLPTQKFGHLGVHPQRRDRSNIQRTLLTSEIAEVELFYIGISPSLGQLTATQLLELVELAKTFGSGNLRLTPWQTIILPDIPQPKIAEVLQNLSAIGLTVSDHRVNAAILACAGKPGCAVAATQTQAHAIALANHLNQRLTLDSPINIHVTGCSKLCAQPSPAEITLLGTAIAQQGEMVEGYQIYVGDDQQSFKHWLGDVTATAVPARIEQILHLYQRYRKTSNESLGAFISRNGLPS
jgi:ferredoxin-nitrite reductase